MGFLIGVWLFMVVSGFCVLMAAQYMKPSVRDFGSMISTIVVIMFVWAVANVLWLILLATLLGGA